MQTLTLGPAAVSFAAILVVVGIVPRTADLDRSLQALVVALPLGVAAHFLIGLPKQVDSPVLKTVLWGFGALVANVAHFALVAGIYYMVRHANAPAASVFVRVAVSAYVVFLLIYTGLLLERMIRKKHAGGRESVYVPSDEVP